MKVIKIWLTCITVLWICMYNLLAQEPLRMTVEQAEKHFLEKNLQLLAERCNIDIADAAIVQAKLPDNPTISIGEVNFWHPNAVKELGLSSGAGAGTNLSAGSGVGSGSVASAGSGTGSFGRNAAFSLELEQMIRTAGKRRKLIDLEKVSKEIAVQEFEALLLGLKTELRVVLNETVYLQSYGHVIRTMKASVESLVEVYKTQTIQGNVAKNELIRLQVSLIELESEANEVQTALNKQYKDLKVLLNLSASETNLFILPQEKAAKHPDEISLAALFEMAEKSRPEWLLSDRNREYSERLSAYEKSQRKPDVTFSIKYDRYGGVWRNFVGAGVRLDLPVFNRNQGAVRMEKAKIEQSQYQAEIQANAIRQEITEIHSNYVMNFHFYEKLMAVDFPGDMEAMATVYARNLLNKNINMLEYLDFMYACKSTRQAILNAEKNLNTSFAELQCSINNEL